ncbi:50S ribosomal protein L29 [Candidatus Woesearchaeota archaeon CG10_big_fil_rev_8_21_14_0_10_30_7]|nr:MAG: 50S ribosomal protein L29 [Candidatus Woesearchaeota archaeon CG10_big_fil_rev_8_21_14_0_10_30_7]
MKIRELRTLGKEELELKMKETYLELMKENSSIASGSAPKNPGKVKVMKKTIAKIKTIQSEGIKKI